MQFTEEDIVDTDAPLYELEQLSTTLDEVGPAEEEGDVLKQMSRGIHGETIIRALYREGFIIVRRK